jgi:hypothetical protein
VTRNQRGSFQCIMPALYGSANPLRVENIKSAWTEAQELVWKFNAERWQTARGNNSVLWGRGCKPFLYVCYVRHFTTYSVLVTTLDGSFISVFSAMFVHRSCFFPNTKVNFPQRVRYRSYSPRVSVYNTISKHKPTNECFDVPSQEEHEKGELDCGVHSEK